MSTQQKWGKPNLDISALVGEDEQGRYIELLVFGKTWERFYLITEPN
jgi:hypothetical protein